MKADRELMRAVEQMKAGKESGFNLLYSRTYHFVYGRARHAINDEQEAQDLVQEVYLAAYRNIESLQKAENLYAWLGTIILRQGATMARRKKNHVLLSEENQGMFEAIPDESANVEDDVINEENGEILKGLLEKLPTEQKSALISFYYDGLKVEQIAELTETSAGTIKSRLYLARKRLQEYILELERKEGCTLHGFSAPLLLLAIKMLLSETKLSKEAAQEIYTQVCAQVGLQATGLTVGAGMDNVMAKKAGETAGMRKAGETAGVRKAGGMSGETESGSVTEVIQQMKGQGVGMKKFMGKLAALGKVKIAGIAVGTVVVAGAAIATGVYVHNQGQAKEVQAEMEKEQQEQAELEKEKLLADLTERYEKAVELRNNLILEDSVLDDLKPEFEEIKAALDEETADDRTEEIMTTLETELEDYRKQNEKYLTEKEAAMYDYHTELFPEEKQTELDKLFAEYQTLFEGVKYKAADKKLDEMNRIMVAFLNENQDDPTEVAENSADGKNGSTQAGNSQNGNASGNSNGSSNGGSSSSGNEGNAGSGSGNSGGSGNGGNTGSGNGNSDNTGNSDNSGNSSNNAEPGNSENAGGSSETGTETTPAARWADGRCTEVENDIIATQYYSGMEEIYAPFTSQFESIAASFEAGTLSKEEAKQQIIDIVVNNTDEPLLTVGVAKVTCSGSSYKAGMYGIGGCGWYYVRAYYDGATDTITMYVVSL